MIIMIIIIDLCYNLFLIATLFERPQTTATDIILIKDDVLKVKDTVKVIVTNMSI